MNAPTHLHSPQQFNLAIIGLGYVGLPLALEFGKHRPVIGYDIDEIRIEELRNCIDRTMEATSEEVKTAIYLTLTSNAHDLKACNCFIVTVPTPIDQHKRPDLGPLLAATEMIGRQMPEGSTVIYESTVYPGATEEVCVPLLERLSGMQHNVHFFTGYSPERINPGDRNHRLSQIVKITSGSTSEIAKLIDMLYREIITVGTHLAPSIKVAEAAKVIENTQRDLNIALMNELAIIFNLLGIDTEAVLNAAGTKWNFIPFRPGLVGGHCIGVDPYYLTHKAESVGYKPEIILAGRRLNDSMGRYVATQLIKAMAKIGIAIGGSNVLVMGYTFKEDCPDQRNTKVIDIVNELAEYNCIIDVYDPWIPPNTDRTNIGVSFVKQPKIGYYDAIIIAVAHKQFKMMAPSEVRAFGAPKHVVYDLKCVLPKGSSEIRL